MSPNLKLLSRSLLAAATLLTLTLTIDPQTAVAKPDTKIARSNTNGGIFSDMAAKDEVGDVLPTASTNSSAKSNRKSTATTNIPTKTVETNTPSKKTKLTGTEVDKSKSRPQKKTIEKSIEIAANSPTTDRKKIDSNSESKSKSRPQKKSIEKSIEKPIEIATNFVPSDNISELRSLAEGSGEETKSKSSNPKKSIEVTASSSPLESKSNGRSIEIDVKSPKSKKIAMRSPSPYGGTYFRLVRYAEDRTNDIGNPIYTLEAYVDGELKQSIKAISGTATTQERDRNVGENAAPLPDGIYRVSNTIVPGSVAEVGRTFIAITPQFQTGRIDLGIHLDPSYNQRNGRDGTAGCIGITNVTDRDAVNAFVAKYQPRSLYVQISASK